MVDKVDCNQNCSHASPRFCHADTTRDLSPWMPAASWKVSRWSPPQPKALVCINRQRVSNHNGIEELVTLFWIILLNEPSYRKCIFIEVANPGWVRLVMAKLLFGQLNDLAEIWNIVIYISTDRKTWCRAVWEKFNEIMILFTQDWWYAITKQCWNFIDGKKFK